MLIRYYACAIVYPQGAKARAALQGRPGVPDANFVHQQEVGGLYGEID